MLYHHQDIRGFIDHEQIQQRQPAQHMIFIHEDVDEWGNYLITHRYYVY